MWTHGTQRARGRMDAYDMRPDRNTWSRRSPVSSFRLKRNRSSLPTTYLLICIRNQSSAHRKAFITLKKTIGCFRRLQGCYLLQGQRSHVLLGCYSNHQSQSGEAQSLMIKKNISKRYFYPQEERCAYCSVTVNLRNHIVRVRHASITTINAMKSFIKQYKKLINL